MFHCTPPVQCSLEPREAGEGKESHVLLQGKDAGMQNPALEAWRSERRAWNATAMASVYLWAAGSYPSHLARQTVLQESSTGPEGSEWERLGLEGQLDKGVS